LFLRVAACPAAVELTNGRMIVDPAVGGRDPGRPSGRSHPDRQACSTACCIPVLQEPSQSRTNRALYIKKGKEGAGQLAELLHMSLVWR